MISEGSTVSIHYTLQVDGNVVDSSTGREPLVYVQGGGQILPHLESHLSGREKGDHFSVTLSPEEGYGSYDHDAVQSVPRSAFDNPGELEIGGIIGIQAQNGSVGRAIVTQLSPEEVTLDMNHPLAGKILEFQVEVVKVVPASPA